MKKYKDKYEGMSIDEIRYIKDGKGKHIRDEWGNLVGIRRDGIPTQEEHEKYMEEKAEEDRLLKSVFNSECFYEDGSRRRRHLYNDNIDESPEEFHKWYAFLKHCVEIADPEGLFLEFGVHKGYSLRALSEWVPKMIYGFDSWKGFEGEWGKTEDEVIPGASFALPDSEVYQLKRQVGPNVRLVSGWYDVSLPKFLEKVEGPCSFIHCDSDTYKSTKEVLDILTEAGRIVEGTIIVFDDFYGYPRYREHEYKAFNEYVKESKVTFEWLAYTSGRCPWNGGQVALRIVEVSSDDPEE